VDDGAATTWLAAVVVMMVPGALDLLLERGEVCCAPS